MSQTLEQILNERLGLGVEKTAEVKQVSELDKLAMDIGLTNESGATSQTEEHTKEAKMSLESMYHDLFSGDAATQEKVAEVNETEAMEKAAAEKEEFLGEIAHEKFAEFLDAHIEKIASEFATAVEHEIEGKIEDNEVEGAMDTKAVTHAEGEAAMADKTPGQVGEVKKALEKSAAESEEGAVALELYNIGSDYATKIAEAADAEEKEEDKEEDKKEEKKPTEEEEKTASERAMFIARGCIDQLLEKGASEKGDALHYLYPVIFEKMAAAKPELFGKMKDMAMKGVQKVKDLHAGAVSKVKDGAKAIKDSKAHPATSKETQAVIDQNIKGHRKEQAKGVATLAAMYGVPAAALAGSAKALVGKKKEDKAE